jgi:uncharacterized repeat protein (TIGR02543 family)
MKKWSIGLIALLVSCVNINLSSVTNISSPSTNQESSIIQSSVGSISSSTLSLVTVTFDSRGGSEVLAQQVETNSFISIPDVTREGHTIEGWYTSLNGGVSLDSKWNFFTNRVNFNFTLYAKWTINQYTIIFETNGGNTINSQSYEYQASLNLPSPLNLRVILVLYLSSDIVIGILTDEEFSEKKTELLSKI